MHSILLQIVLSFAIAFFTVILLIPPIIKVARGKKLYSNFKKNGDADKRLSPLGGIAIFAGVTFGSIFATCDQSFDNLKYVLSAILLVFFIGLKDDIIKIPHRKKLIAQFGAAILIVVFGQDKIMQFYGILGINQIEPFISYPLSIFTVVFVINAYILIDGIKGLVLGLGIVAGITFGYWFIQTEQIYNAVLAFSLVGSLVAHIVFNETTVKNKIKIGETGAQIIGIVIVTLAIRKNETAVNYAHVLPYISNPLLIFSVIAIPVFDALRVLTGRILKGVSPFNRDETHIHHYLLKHLGSENKATAVLILSCVFMIATSVIVTILELRILLQLGILFFELLLLYSFSLNWFGLSNRFLRSKRPETF